MGTAARTAGTGLVSDYFDRSGSPITLEQYMRLSRDDLYRRVAVTETRHYVISTIWLGLDHGWGMGRPEFFETMVFARAEWDDYERAPGLHDIDSRRYSSEAEAHAGHAEMVTLVRATEQELLED